LLRQIFKVPELVSFGWVRDLEGPKFQGPPPLGGLFPTHFNVEFDVIDPDLVCVAANEGLRAGCNPCPANVDMQGAFPDTPLEGDAFHCELKGICETDPLDLAREAGEGANSILRQASRVGRIQDRPDDKRKSQDSQRQQDRESRKGKNGFSDDYVHTESLSRCALLILTPFLLKGFP
jgi:hypothetical protein